MNKYNNSSSKANISNDNSSNTSIVAQFTVYTSQTYLSALLDVFHDNDLNISAFTLTEENGSLKFRFIPIQNRNQTSNDIDLTRNLLKEYRFSFDEIKVVRLKLSDHRDLLTYKYSELMKVLSLYNSYTGNDGSIIYETCCPIKALKLLNELSY